MKSKASGCGSILTVFSGIVLLCVSSIIIIIIIIITIIIVGSNIFVCFTLVFSLSMAFIESEAALLYVTMWKNAKGICTTI